MEFPAWSLAIPAPDGSPGLPVVPSVIAFTDDGAPRIGAEAGAAGHRDPAATRWLKHYLISNSSIQVAAGKNRYTSAKDAAGTFLTQILTQALGQDGQRETEVTFTLPSDAPPHYPDWLAGIAATSGIRTFHFVDELSAAIRGCTGAPDPHQPVLVVDIGGITHVASVVLFDEQGEHAGLSWCRVRVAGRADGGSGGVQVDTWLADALIARDYPYISDTQKQECHAALVRECGSAKERLSAVETTEVTLPDPGTGIPRSHPITRGELETVLNRHLFGDTLNRTIDRALSAALMRGYASTAIGTVILTGGCAAIPLVQELVRKRFSGCTVVCDRPLWATARGAAMDSAIHRTRDTIRHDYALRYWDQDSLAHGYRLLVRSGTPYPSAGQVARLVISAAYDGQTHLGIPVYELARDPDEMPGGTIELVADTGGGLRCADAVTGITHRAEPVWVNERAPTFLVATPPATKGEPRFELTFSIDGSKQLRVTARDVLTGRLIRQDCPLFRMT
jgi:molecular chaperone DnaK (HSP70)